MSKHFRFYARWCSHVHTGLDKILHRLSTYVLPVLIGLVSVVTLFAWETHYPATHGKPLEFRVLEESGGELATAQALTQLESRPNVRHYDTGLSEKPIWFAFFIQPDDGNMPLMAEFPSRHAMETACWDAKNLRPLGRADRRSSEGGISPVKAGFALALESSLSDTHVLCRASFVGPARLSAMQWPASELQMATEEFHRNSGLLDGGLIVLALFMLITALINRESTYLLFAAWVVVNLRVGALSAGWDSQWLGHTIPPEWILQTRLVTIAVFYVLTITLFRTLFRDDLAKVGYTSLLRFTQWTCLPVLLLSAILPYKSFLPFMWVSTGFSIAVLLFFLARILMLMRSPVAMWYGASMCIALFANLYEVISAALGFKVLIGTVNSVTAALSSSLLAALAIAEQMRVEHKQRLEAQAELEHTYEAMPIGLFTLDLRGQFLSVNPALLTMLNPYVTTSGHNLWNQYFNGGAWSQLHHMVHSQTGGELELRNKDGSKHFLVKATLARGKIEGSLQEVTEKFKATEELRFMANHDPLTKVFNRRGIERMFDNAAGPRAKGKPLALAYLDLDRFKLINDLFGHAAGDDVLKQVCERISVLLAGGQQFGRFGGDEFVIIMPGTTIPLASLICRGILDSIGTVPYRVGDKAFHVGGSIGLIEVSPGTEYKDAVSAADRACREAKAGHSEGLVVYEKNAAAFRERQAELALVERLSSSNATDSLFLEMQPIMSLKAPHESLNFEVLLRMRDDDGNVIPAGRIISAAESSGCIGVVDRWVLSTTLAWLNINYGRLTRTQFVCMNLSGASLNDERFIQDTIAMLAQNAHTAGRLCIEITESVALHDLDNTRRFIDKVRSYGVRVGLDDFGAGYTSFSYLKELPADVLKIDGNFIVNMNAHPANVAIVEAIVSLATNLGMKTIAEWAEDSGTVETLAEIGVDYVQGYAVARPQEPARLLTAASSANFIHDERLMRFVSTLQASAKTLAQMDLLDLRRFKDVH